MPASPPIGHSAPIPWRRGRGDTATPGRSRMPMSSGSGSASAARTTMSAPCRAGRGVARQPRRPAAGRTAPSCRGWRPRPRSIRACAAGVLPPSRGFATAGMTAGRTSRRPCPRSTSSDMMDPCEPKYWYSDPIDTPACSAMTVDHPDGRLSQRAGEPGARRQDPFRRAARRRQVPRPVPRTGKRAGSRTCRTGRPARCRRRSGCRS